MIKDIIDPPTAHGQPLFRAVLKRSPADFRVEEKLGIECSGDGEHLLLQIEKTAMNTDEVLSLLQEWYAVASADVGYCGMKDRHSISSQWISIRSPLDASVFEQAAHQYGEEQQARKSLRLLASTRHSRKLRRGAHSKNEFVITLQDIILCDFEPTDIEPTDISPHERAHLYRASFQNASSE